MSVIELTEKSFDTAINSPNVLVDFYAEWCGPCRAQAPVLEAFAERYEGRVKVAKLDVDQAPSVAQRRADAGGLPRGEGNGAAHGCAVLRGACRARWTGTDLTNRKKAHIMHPAYALTGRSNFRADAREKAVGASLSEAGNEGRP